MQRGAWLCLWAGDNTETLCCLRGLRLLPGHGGDLQEVRAARCLRELGSGLAGADHHKNITKKHKILIYIYPTLPLFLSLLGFQRMLACVAAVCVPKACAKLAMLKKKQPIFTRHCQKHQAAAVSIGHCNKLLVPDILKSGQLL